MKPTSRQTFKDFCLRSLGWPVINIEVDDDQVDDRIDEALSYYADYHFDATEKVYYKHILTQQDIDSQGFDLPDNILGVVGIFPTGFSSNQASMFDIRYQIALNDLYSLTSVSIVPYYVTFQHLQLIEQILVGQVPIRFQRHKNHLNVDMSKEKLVVGQYIIVEAYQVINPDEFIDVWGDRWLYRYATALIKKQWGNNLKKYGKIAQVGGTTFNGQEIYNEASEEISKMEKEVIDGFGSPIIDMIG